jgi:hypothetical protein
MLFACLSCYLQCTPGRPLIREFRVNQGLKKTPPRVRSARSHAPPTDGQALAYMYFEKEPRRRSRRELLTRDEAQRIAAIFLGEPEE